MDLKSLPSTDLEGMLAFGDWMCSTVDCTRVAVASMKFVGQFGHVHVCQPCLDDRLETCAVRDVLPMPCPLSHAGDTWIDTPTMK